MAILFKQSLLIFLLVISFCQCDVFFPANGKHHSYAMASFSHKENTFFNYEKPDKVRELDEELSEISGLDFNDVNNSLLAINDEKGFIYELNISDFDIISKNQFWNTGDYEGVEFDGKLIWVLKSNGKLYKYDPINKETEDFETKLSSENDVEGLCYDKVKDVFYLACKGITLDKDDKLRTKAVYSYDLKKGKLNKKPVLEMHPKKIKQFIESVAIEDIDENYIDRIEVFSPSAIAMNKGRDLFILSARGSVLLVVDFELNIKEVTFLNPKYLPQPEGICFDADDNMYLSTEGKSKKARLLLYKHH